MQGEAKKKEGRVKRGKGRGNREQGNEETYATVILLVAVFCSCNLTTLLTTFFSNKVGMSTALRAKSSTNMYSSFILLRRSLDMWSPARGQ
jgi:hypothetical protein